MTKKFVVTVAGNMGVGKSTLTNLLAQTWGWTPAYEAVDDNPYIADFYNDMRQWSFHSQLFFLSRRLHNYRQMLQQSGSVIQDRSVYEDAEIFARNLYERGNMSKRDFKLYRELYEEFARYLPPPDLIVYLKASVPTLIGRVQRRGRDYERDISPLYLQQLNELYNGWIEDFTICPILVIPADHIDFVKNPLHFNAIKEQIITQLNENNPVQPVMVERNGSIRRPELAI